MALKFCIFLAFWLDRNYVVEYFWHINSSFIILATCFQLITISAFCINTNTAINVEPGLIGRVDLDCQSHITWACTLYPSSKWLIPLTNTYIISMSSVRSESLLLWCIFFPIFIYSVSYTKKRRILNLLSLSLSTWLFPSKFNGHRV